ncbi:MAG TPA: hypothetical protein VE034_09280 [Burkholderiales bacterium]|nr:hypothetical protein [Burkholderiales bacterium]
MSNRENQDPVSGILNTLTMAVIAIAVCVAALMLMPAHAGSEGPANVGISAATTDAKANAVTRAADGVGYLPAQYVNQAKEADPMPETF